MNILPVNEPIYLKKIDDFLGNRIDTLSFPKAPFVGIDTRYLDYIAAMFDVDITLYTQSEAKEVLKKAIWSKNKVGTIGAIKKMLQTFDPQANIITHATCPKHDGKIQRNGITTYRNYGLTHWAMYKIELTRAISISQKEELITQLKILAPARCKLINIDAQNTIIHDGRIKRNANYTYGGYING
ncbi:conserved hypothetical protein, putative phage tail protein [Sulfurovum sp. enrichment culture clone C5]|uniref:Phage tail protein n=1 Tax=Sulfurovum sp. enrichment culture clone C5 TaxID=497650 RepID=A0A0S4XMP9_9BACT|nr:conserved hypothetical protein, putative phage tail protein [Sulfurovum sp. enrichment culture clone C5]